MGAANSESVAELVVTDCAIAYTASSDSETDTAVSVMESRPLPAGTNLKRAFVAATLEHIDAGWQLGEFGSRGELFFCTRGGERRMVSMEILKGRRLSWMAGCMFSIHTTNVWQTGARSGNAAGAGRYLSDKSFRRTRLQPPALACCLL